MLFFFSSRRRHTRWTGDWSSDVCSSDLVVADYAANLPEMKQLETNGVNTIATDASEKAQKYLQGNLTREGQNIANSLQGKTRSEERRVGKECRSQRSTYHEKKIKNSKEQ